MPVTSKSLANFNVVRLQDAILCADCESITDTHDNQCSVCGGHALLTLAKVLGGSLQRELSVAVHCNAKPIEPSDSLTSFSAYKKVTNSTIAA